MIVVTGAAGFVGSCLLAHLANEGYGELVAVDEFTNPEKEKNLTGLKIYKRLDRKDFIQWINQNGRDIQIIIHLGARTDTTEFNVDLLNELNFHYTQKVWTACIEHQIPLVYASSAATYGEGEFGYDDNHELPFKLQPLNPYGVSKNDFDKWAIEQQEKPFFWAGLKFFNVYGPNEYHKGRMASVIFHTHRQIKEGGLMKLFRSHRSDYADGMQLRDFVYVKDVVKVCQFFMENRNNSGLYNLGTGQARAFLDLSRATFRAMDLEPNIEFIDIPADIRDKYQYFTEANMNKLRSVGYSNSFYSLEEGVEDYVKGYLIPQQYFH